VRSTISNATGWGTKGETHVRNYLDCTVNGRTCPSTQFQIQRNGEFVLYKPTSCATKMAMEALVCLLVPSQGPFIKLACSSS